MAWTKTVHHLIIEGNQYLIVGAQLMSISDNSAEVLLNIGGSSPVHQVHRNKKLLYNKQFELKPTSNKMVKK